MNTWVLSFNGFVEILYHLLQTRTKLFKVSLHHYSRSSTIIWCFQKIKMTQRLLSMHGKFILIWWTIWTCFLNGFFSFIRTLTIDIGWYHVCAILGFFLFKDKKINLPDSLLESIDAIDLDEFIHGWLIFDPFYSFCNKAELSDQRVVLRDSCIWFLNSAFMYTECLHEKTLALLDFGFHRYLR